MNQLPRGPRTKENRPPRIAAWLDHWFPRAEDQELIRAMSRQAKGKWKGKSAWGKFQGWVTAKGSMPIRIEGFWDPPQLEGFCSACGPLERCVHVAALALCLDGGDDSSHQAPREAIYPCVPVLVLNRFQTQESLSKVRLTDGGRLSFRYGPRSIEETERLESVGWKEEGQEVRCPRDLAAEERFRERLDELGWRRHGLSVVRRSSSESVETLLDFLEIHVPALRQEGWEIEVGEQLPLKLVEVKSWSGSLTEDKGWFGMSLSVDTEQGPLELIDLCRQILSASNLESVLSHLHSGLSLTVQISGGYLRLPADRMLPIFSGLAFLLTQDAKAVRVSKLLAAGLGLMGIEDWQGLDRLEGLRETLASVHSPRTVNLPDTLHATLRPYQVVGLSWLQWLSEHGFGGVLADDMGLGKTLQTIAHIACEHRAGRLENPCLVVCPTSLAPNWSDEFARFAPDLRVVVLHGAQRHQLREEADAAQVVITTYSLLSRDEEWLLDRKWHMVVLDEAQTLKNSKTQARAVAQKIPSRLRLALTGTPLENHLGELWSLFDLLVPGLLGTQRHFHRCIRPRIEKLGDEDLRNRLREVVAPFLLRRTKSEVAADLPEKTEIVQYVELEGHQRDLYETVRIAQDQKLRQILAQQGFETSSIQILDALLRLRQTCCDPRLLPLDISKGCLESAKLEWVDQNLPEMVEEGRRILVFSQFTGFLDLVEPILSSSKIEFLRLDGSTQDRGAVVRAFQEGQAPVFLLSLKAGGIGLNLTAADTVVFLDPWWNPAVEAQAMDRAHRIGQSKPVFVYRLVARGTVEERIVALQKRKAELAASILEGGGAASLDFTPEVLSDLFRPLG